MMFHYNTLVVLKLLLGVHAQEAKNLFSLLPWLPEFQQATINVPAFIGNEGLMNYLVQVDNTIQQHPLVRFNFDDSGLLAYAASGSDIGRAWIHHQMEANCRDHTLHFRPTFVLTGEPVVLKCPLLRYGQTNGFDPQLNITWAKNGSAAIIPTGYKGARIFSQDDALWFLPVSLEDSGVYICTFRNSSYCSDVAVHLQVVEKSSVHIISYPQKAFISSPGKLVCPNLESFIQKDTGYALRWYKDSTPLDIDNKKFIALKNTHYLMISSVSLDDSGYYTCLMTFEHEKTTYNITRIIQLQALGHEKETVPMIVYPNQKITLAVLGSRLTIPCKVYVGENDHSFTDVWWLVNSSYIDTTYHKGRIYEGKAQKLVENDDIYIEVPLIFDPVKEEDFNTDFACVAQNSRGHQIHATQVKQEEHHLPWYLASIPVALAAAIVGVVCIRKHWKKRRPAKGYIAAEI